MTKFKVCSKIHLFIIISAVIIALGMAMGIICQFCANGFFNYGGEFSSYKTVTVKYYNTEYTSVDDIKSVCEDSLGGLGAYEVSYAETSVGGDVVYKFSYGTEDSKLESAVEKLNAAIKAEMKAVNGDDVDDDILTVASFHTAEVTEGGAKAIMYAAIALASAAAFQFIYYIFRYKLRTAYSALLSCIHNLGVFIAIVALTRIPVGTELVALSALVVFATMTLCGLFFNRTKGNFKLDKYAKTERKEVVEISAQEVRPLTFGVCCAIAAAALVLGVFAFISSLYIGAAAPYLIAIIGAVAVCYGTTMFVPAVHCAIDSRCEAVRISMKEKAQEKSKASAKPVKAAKSVSPEEA